MNRLLLLVCLFALVLLMGCQPLIAETGTGSAPVAVLAPPLTSLPPLTTTVALTSTAAPTLSLPIPVLLTNTLSAATPIQQAADPAVAEAGLQLYRQYYCGVCHQLTAAGTKGTFGPSHDGIGHLAVQRLQAPIYRGTATTVAEYLHESLVDPQVYIVPGYELTPHRMPSFSFLPADELNTLVQWLSQQ